MTSSDKSDKIITWRKSIIAKGTQYSQQFKEDAVRYREDHPELTIRKTADNLGISESALKSWIKASKENDGVV